MSKYTNADLFMKTFNGMYATELWSLPEKDFLEWLNAPAADVVEVVRCKDCIHRNKFICPFSVWHGQKFADVMEFSIKSNVEDSDYCFIGERKDG